MASFPYKCLHPRRVEVNGDYINVPCGRCEACTVSKAMRRKSLIDMESTDYKYCMFVTLTYSDENVPTMQLIRDDSMYVSYFVDSTRRKGFHSPVGEDEPLFVLSYNDFFPSPSNLRKLSNKIHRPQGEFMYLYYKDCQDFIKRLRRKINYHIDKNNETENKIKYFYVGEYTPLHFRPHFHCLFFFNSDSVYRSFPDLVSSCWTFGINRTELSKGGCSSYVSSYINGFASVPSIYAQSPIAQKSLHSIRFGEQLYKDQYEEIGRIDDSMFARKCGDEFGLRGEFSAPLSLERRLYPKCQRFVHLNKGELFLSYCSYSFAVEQYKYIKNPPSTIVEYAKTLCEDFNSPLTRDLRVLYGDDLYYDAEKLSRILRVSAQFLKNCELYDITPIDYVDAICCYYKKKEFAKLRTFYSDIDQFILDWCESDVSNFKYINLFYDESYYDPSPSVEFVTPQSIMQSSFPHSDDTPCVVKWKGSPMYCDYHSRSIGNIDRMTKHKKINDYNKLFCKTIE